MKSAVSRWMAVIVAAGAACGVTDPAMAQLRIATWNVSGYNGSNREEAFKTAIYGSFQGRRMAPDVLMAQEMRTQAGLNAFRTLLNTAPGSPGDWAVGPFVASPDGNVHGFFYRTSKVQYIGMTVVSPGGNGHPRPLQRFDIRPVGYSAPATTLACYVTHMKAGATASDQQQRLVEAQFIRGDVQELHEEWNFLLAGDLNIQSSFQQAYQWLVGAQVVNPRRFFDPIRTPGNWNINEDFRFVHTQAPVITSIAQAGMDDRLDQILLSASLMDGRGFSYIGDTNLPYSTTTWNDPNHSYRVWGNDGTSFRQEITIQGNQMVGAVIAQALHDAASTDQMGGHLPVFLDLRVPPKVDSVVSLEFGEVALGAPAQRPLVVRNSGDVQLWTVAGISVLEYSLEATAGFGAPTGQFATMPGAPGGSHIITMDTSTPGVKEGVVTILSSAPDQPARQVLVSGIVTIPCHANCDGSTVPPALNIDDFTCFINSFAEGQSLPPAQQVSHYANCDGSTLPPVLNIDDFTCFINAFALGCP